MEKALIAMSGGVDSSVAAYLAKQSGYDCIGVTMKLYDNEDIVVNSNTCCSLSDIEDARSVAHKLNIPYYVLNFKADFEETVIKNFVQSYIAGRTPNPCIECNRHLKWKSLLARAEEIGAKHIVTGHYARVKFDENSGRYLLLKAADNAKDQSYVLYSMTQKELSKTLFPLGELTKPRVRKIAAELELPTAEKNDSQDICFVPDGDYAAFIEKRLEKSFKKGDFLDKNGKILGQHNGIIRYTIGQRKGLGIALGAPAFVSEINAKDNTVTLTFDEQDLLCPRCTATDINLISVDNLRGGERLLAKTRYSAAPAPAIVTQDGDKLIIEFESPQRAVTKGQAVVLYKDDIVVGGGTIA